MDKIHLVVIEKKLLNQKPSFHVIPCANKEKAWEIVRSGKFYYCIW